MRKKAEIKKYDANVLDTIGKDGDLLSLTDLWKIAGSPKSKNPNDWLRQDIKSNFTSSLRSFSTFQYELDSGMIAVIFIYPCFSQS